MHWVIGLLLVVLLCRVEAQETPVSTQELEQSFAENAYEQTIVKFNTGIKDFPSWAAFKTEGIGKVLPGTMGKCYERTSSSLQPVQITMVPFQAGEGEGWQKTSGQGWRLRRKVDGILIEYRLNAKAGVLLRAESVKFLFFPPQTKKLCEFPLGN